MNHSIQRLYYLVDHLGSVRVVLKEDGGVESWSDYYPFGKESRGSSTSNEPKELFTGKERDIEIGLDYFGARYYNAEIGRWVTRDPISDKYPHLSPYNYSANNPIAFLDPNGLEIIISEAVAKTQAFQDWKNSSHGKAFYAAFSEGGAWSDMDVYFEPARSVFGYEIESELGNMGFPNTQSGHTALYEDGSFVSQIEKNVKDPNAFQPDSRSSYYFIVTINAYGRDFSKMGYSTITHETDHVIYMTYQIKKGKKIGTALYQHKTLGMEGQGGNQYKLLPQNNEDEEDAPGVRVDRNIKESKQRHNKRIKELEERNKQKEEEDKNKGK